MEKDIAELVIEYTEDLKKLGIALITLLAVNIIGLLSKFAVESSLKNKEIKINKAGIINSRKLTIQESLFHLLDTLTLVDPTDTQQLSTEIQQAETFIRKNKLFLDKRITRISYHLLDYFKTVHANPSNKNIFLEMEQLEMYTDEFTQL